MVCSYLDEKRTPEDRPNSLYIEAIALQTMASSAAISQILNVPNLWTMASDRTLDFQKGYAAPGLPIPQIRTKPEEASSMLCDDMQFVHMIVFC